MFKKAQRSSFDRGIRTKSDRNTTESILTVRKRWTEQNGLDGPFSCFHGFGMERQRSAI